MCCSFIFRYLFHFTGSGHVSVKCSFTSQSCAVNADLAWPPCVEECFTPHHRTNDCRTRWLNHPQTPKANLQSFALFFQITILLYFPMLIHLCLIPKNWLQVWLYLQKELFLTIPTPLFVIVVKRVLSVHCTKRRPQLESSVGVLNKNTTQKTHHSIQFSCIVLSGVPSFFCSKGTSSFLDTKIYGCFDFVALCLAG